MSYYKLLENRITQLESLIYNEANKSISDTIDNARQAASFLKSLGFIKGKKVSGTTSAYYYIGNDCGIILSSSALFFPKKYNVTKDILDTDYTLVNTLPALGFALQKKGLQPSKNTIDETIAYTLLNNGRDATIGFPASKDEIEENISNAQKDGKKIRTLINAYFDKISNKKESLIYNEAKENTSGTRVKKELLNLVKDGVVTWEELARECIYWMPTNIVWSVIGELGEGYEDDLDDDMIDSSQEADDFEMPDFDKVDTDESFSRRSFRRKCESNSKFHH